MPKLSFDHYLTYEELTDLLQAYQTEHPNLVQISSIGKSYEGRDIWLATVTDSSTGTSESKPAFWVDGNIHASEVSATTAALCVLDKLICNPILKTHTFYVVPRLGPDGAEWALATPPKIIRSSTRPYPFDEEDPHGLETQDLDGDGRILQMRVEDSNGAWKVSDLDPRLMKRRDPGETGGTYYRLMSEGLFHNFDGLTMRPRQRKEGLDMNRNFPSAWRQEHEQHGAGPFPTSEPEIRAAVEAIVGRPNICGAVTFHTFAGVNLRPPSRMPDEDIPSEDLWAFQKIGDKGKEMTGYPGISNYHEFRYHPKEVITGVFDDWMYEHRGVFAWTTEIWSPQRQAGITDYKYIDWFREHPHEDDLQLLRWSDTKLNGKAFHAWRSFNHPQLGEVEIGGWDYLYAFRNPPTEFLESEVGPLAEWVIWQASLSPRLELMKEEVVDLGSGVKSVRIAVRNAGWLPTNVTRIAKDRKLVRGVIAEISASDHPSGGSGSSTPAWLVGGKLRQEAGQLAGWSHVTAGGGMFGAMTGTDDVAIFDWVVKDVHELQIEVRHDRAGTIRLKLSV